MSSRLQWTSHVPVGHTFNKDHWVALPELPPVSKLTIRNSGREVTLEPLPPESIDYVAQVVARPIFWGCFNVDVEEWVLQQDRVRVVMQNDTDLAFDLYLWGQEAPPDYREATYFVDEKETTTLDWSRAKLRQLQLVELG